MRIVVEPLVPPPPPPVRHLQTMELEGMTRDTVSRASRDGRLHRIARGSYLEKEETDPLQLHLARAHAAAPRLPPGMVFSHVTAALLHGLTGSAPVAGTVIHLSRPGTDGGGTRRDRAVHAVRLLPVDVTEVGLLPVTGVARTVVDCARTLPFTDAVSLADRALRTTDSPEQVRRTLSEAADRLTGCKGVGMARRVIAFADPGAANRGESILRSTLHLIGLPPAVVQLHVTDPSDPYFDAWADLGWPEHRTLLEFDGALKYKAGNPSRRPGHVVLLEEKAREDRLRGLDWQVVRVVWSDLQRPDLIAARVRRAFVRVARGRPDAR